MTRDSGKAVLVIDDDAEIGRFIVDTLSGSEFDTNYTQTLDAFKRTYRDGIFDAFLIDLQLSETDGFAILRYLSDQKSTAPVILMSGCDERLLKAAARVARSRGLNLAGSLAKPFSQDALLDMLLAADPSAHNPEFEACKWKPERSNVEAALRKGEFVPYYQPKICLRTGKVVGVEALARWLYDESVIIPPNLFLPVIQQSGLIDELTYWILLTAVRDQRIWRTEGFNPTVSVNVDASSITNATFPDNLSNFVRTAKGDNKSIMIEVTENSAVTQFADSIESATRLRMKNFGLSIDDFGTGHSTLLQLQRMPFTELKIDRSFIHRLHRSVNSEIFVGSTIDLAHGLHIDVVAEGVETIDQHNTLKKLGCDLGQGFLYSPALSSRDLVDWMKAHDGRDWDCGHSHQSPRPPPSNPNDLDVESARDRPGILDRSQ